MPRVSKAQALTREGKLKKGCKYGSDKRPLCPGDFKAGLKKAKPFCKPVKIHGVVRTLCWANTDSTGIIDNKGPKKKAAKKTAKKAKKAKKAK